MRIGLVELLLILLIASLTIGPSAALWVDRWMRRARLTSSLSSSLSSSMPRIAMMSCRSLYRCRIS